VFKPIGPNYNVRVYFSEIIYDRDDIHEHTQDLQISSAMFQLSSKLWSGAASNIKS